MRTKEQTIIQETFCKLYLRLNGYLTSGFIIHDKVENKQKGEVDILAVRFPGHSQDESEHNSSHCLEVPNNIDFIIGEVKSKGESVQFNRSLSTLNDLEGWEKIIKWLGVLQLEDVTPVAKKLNALVVPKENEQINTLKSVSVNTSCGIVSFRPVLFCPETINTGKSSKFINWAEINNYIWNCLCPIPGSRETCSTRYDFNSWGSDFSDIVKIYKERQKTRKKLTKIQELYEELL